MKSLTPQLEAFCAAMVIHDKASDAYRAAYPEQSSKWKNETIQNRAYRLRNKPEVKARIEELRAKASRSLEITVERVLKERARLAFFDPRRLLDEDGNPRPVHQLDDDTAAVIAGLEVDSVTTTKPGTKAKTTTRTTKIKLASKHDSLQALERHLGIYKDGGGQVAPLSIHIHLER